MSEDNAGRRTDPQSERPGRKPTPSYIPLVAAGDQGSATVSLDSPGRYLVTVKAPGHKLWGKHFSLPRRAGEQVCPAREVPPEARKARHPCVPRPAARQRGARLHRRGKRRARPRGLRGSPPRHRRRAAGRLQRRPTLRRRVPDGRRRERHDPEPRAGQVRDRGSPARRHRLAPDHDVRGHAPHRLRPRDRERRREGSPRRGQGRREDQNGLVVRVRPADGPARHVQPVRVDHRNREDLGRLALLRRDLYFGEPDPSPIVALSDIGGRRRRSSRASATRTAASRSGTSRTGRTRSRSSTRTSTGSSATSRSRYPIRSRGAAILDLNIEDVKGELGVPVARWFGRPRLRLRGQRARRRRRCDSGRGGKQRDPRLRSAQPGPVRGRHRRSRPRPPLARRQRQGATFTGPHPETASARLLRVPGAPEPAREVPHQRGRLRALRADRDVAPRRVRPLDRLAASDRARGRPAPQPADRWKATGAGSTGASASTRSTTPRRLRTTASTAASRASCSTRRRATSSIRHWPLPRTTSPRSPTRP